MTTVLLYCACVLIWGTTWYAITLQLGVVAPEVSLVYRFGTATLCLLVFAILRGTNLRLTPRDHAFALLQGVRSVADDASENTKQPLAFASALRPIATA